MYETLMNDKCSKGVKTSETQKLLKNFISPYTPYNGLLLWWGVGVGKTCTAVKISESFIGSDPFLVQNLSTKFIVEFIKNIKKQELPILIKNQREMGLDFHFLDLKTIKEVSRN